MSQYPSPYSPPPPYPPQQTFGYYPMPQGDPLAPAKRASILMFVLGALVLLGGTCIGAMSAAMRSVNFPPEQKQQMDQWEQMAGMPVERLFLVIGVFLLAMGVVLVVLGFFVRRGGLGSIITASILTGLILLWSLVSTAGALLHPANADAGVGICMGVFMIAAAGTLLVLLVNAAKASGRVAMAKHQYQAQYWQYQQNMQAYGSGYGYGQQQQQPPAPGAYPYPPPPQQQMQPPPPPPPSTGGSDDPTA
jgi:hypothetical protein